MACDTLTAVIWSWWQASI